MEAIRAELAMEGKKIHPFEKPPDRAFLGRDAHKRCFAGWTVNWNFHRSFSRIAEPFRLRLRTNG